MSRKDSSARSSLALVWGFIFGLLYFFFIRPQLLKWGTVLGESQRRLPGDDLIPTPNAQSTCAVDIDAPPEAVWPWLAQMGRDRTGWYSIDLLDNGGIPSATYLRRDLADPQPGMLLDRGFRVIAVEPDRLLLLGSTDRPTTLGTATDVSILYWLERKQDGSARLLVRLRGYAHGLAGQLGSLALEPFEFLKVYRQLEEIKLRAETMSHLYVPAPVEHEISLS